MRTGKTGLLVHLIDELRLGGAQTHLVTMLREACQRYPFRHRVLSLFGDGPIGEELRAVGVEVVALDLRPQLARRRFLAAANLLRRWVRGAAVVEAHLTWSRLLGLYAAWRERAPVRIGFEQGDIYLNSWKFRVANFVHQAFAQRIVVCSQALADWVSATHRISRRRLLVMHNCVDTDRFRPGLDADVSVREGWPPEATVFAAVGSLGRGVNKRVDICLKALALARERGADVRLVVCGDGQQRPELQELAMRLGLDETVRFLGTRRDVERVLAASDGLCHAAPFEPFGIVAIEAMACGLPVIVPGSGGIREAVEHGKTGFLYPALDHAALADWMITLHRQPDLRREVGLRARQTVESTFSVERYVRRLYALYGLDT